MTTIRITFETSDFEFAHGKRPRGRGAWAFCTRRDANGGDADIFWANGTYADAKRAARAYYAERVRCHLPVECHNERVTVWVLS